MSNISSRALLPQPGGFECRCQVEVIGDPNELPVADRANLREYDVGCCSARRAAPPLAADADHLVPLVDHLVDLDLPLREHPEPVVFEERLDLFVAAVDTESRDAGRRGIPDDLRRPDAFAHDSVDSATVEGLETAPDQFLVLPRHIPPSITAETPAWATEQSMSRR